MEKRITIKMTMTVANHIGIILLFPIDGIMHRSIVSSLPCLIATFLHGYQDIDANGGTQRNEKLGEAAFDVKNFFTG